MIRVDESNYVLLWSYHHIILDGWSVATVMKELSSLYETSSATTTTPSALTRTVPPYRSYIEWLRNQPMDQAKTFWKRHLDGFTSPTPLPMTVSSSNSKLIDQHTNDFSVELATQIQVRPFPAYASFGA